MLVLTHPLHPYRLADCAREQRSILGCIVGTQATIATRPLAKEDSNIFFGNFQQFGDSLPRPERSLCPGPDCNPILVDIGDGTRRPEHPMQLKRPVISCFESLGCLGECRIRIAFVNWDLVAKALSVFEVSSKPLRRSRAFSSPALTRSL